MATIQTMYLQRDLGRIRVTIFCTGDTTISIVGVDVAINHVKVYCCHGNATVGSYSLLSSQKIFHTVVNKKN
jgi:hypothetical protein